MRLTGLFALAIIGSLAPFPAAAETADVIFTGGDILTMRGPAAEYAESLAVKDGTILFVGPRAEAEKLVGPETRHWP